jgi:predicted glycoside hydrolase/deacetylase ChbG (UPF0249 family)
MVVGLAEAQRTTRTPKARTPTHTLVGTLYPGDHQDTHTHAHTCWPPVSSQATTKTRTPTRTHLLAPCIFSGDHQDTHTHTHTLTKATEQWQKELARTLRGSWPKTAILHFI